MANTLSLSTLDNRESKLMFFTGPRRVCEMRFKEDGMLLPFSHCRAEYTVPNPYGPFSSLKKGAYD